MKMLEVAHGESKAALPFSIRYWREQSVDVEGCRTLRSPAGSGRGNQRMIDMIVVTSGCGILYVLGDGVSSGHRCVHVRHVSDLVMFDVKCVCGVGTKLLSPTRYKT